MSDLPVVRFVDDAFFDFHSQPMTGLDQIVDARRFEASAGRSPVRCGKTSAKIIRRSMPPTPVALIALGAMARPEEQPKLRPATMMSPL